MYSFFESFTRSIITALSTLPVLELFRRDLWETKIGVLKSPVMLGFLPFCIILPTIISASRSPDDYLSDNVAFLYVKLWSVSAGVTSILFFNYIMPAFEHEKETLIRSMTMASILAANILEASVKQLFFHDNRDHVDYVNGICGLIITTTTIMSIYKKPITIKKEGKITEIECNFFDSYILAYTLWNILFISKVAPEISFLLFFMVSHLVGIVCHYTKYADFLFVRAVCLLLYIILKFGVTPKYRIFPDFFDPEYNTLDNSLIKFLYDDYYLNFMMGFVIGLTSWNIYDVVLLYKK